MGDRIKGALTRWWCAMGIGLVVFGLAGAAVSAPARIAAPDQAGLIAGWFFDDIHRGLASNLSEHTAGATLQNVTRTSGVVGDAVELNGINSFLEAPDPRQANIRGAFTIAFWMRPTAWAAQQSPALISKKRSDSEPGYVIYRDGMVAPTRINLRISGTKGARDLPSTAAVDDGQWQHWAVTYDPQTGTAIWYRNGRRDTVYRSVRIGDTSNDTPLRIGYAHTWGGYYDGRLDELLVYERTLSGREIESLYVRGRAAALRDAQPTGVVPIRWRIVATRYPTSDYVVAGCSVMDAGARGDGVTDDTAAFQRAMTAMARAGGGTVFVPEGRYVIRGNLDVPTGVTLRGDWIAPTHGATVRGTVLMAYAGRWQREGKPFIALRQCSGLIGLSIWYPEQDPARIVPYPFCIQQMGGDNATVKHVTLVNAYQGIRTIRGSELHYFHDIYGSPLAVGIQIDFVSDSGRVDTVSFGPEFWSLSGLPGAPPLDGPHAEWMRRHGVGMLFRRYEWIYSAFVTVTGYHTGIRMVNSPTLGENNGQMYRYTVTGCGIALDLVDANFAGLSLTDCRLEGDAYGLVTRSTFNSRLLCHSCIIRGGLRAALMDGIDAQSILLYRCIVVNGLDRLRGDLVMIGCTVTDPAVHIRLGPGVNAVTIVGNSYNGAARIEDRSVSGKVRISDDPAPAVTLPAFNVPVDRTLRPARARLFVVRPSQARRRGVEPDDTASIQRALNIAGRSGGGIVFLPGGLYAVRGRLHVPSGVELRGVYDVPHHTLGLGSVIRVYAGRNEEEAAPFLTLSPRSGTRGLTFYYPEQRSERIVPYPWLIQGRGEDLYVVNTTCMNPYRMIDLMSHRCDRHHVEYAAGAPLRAGIAVGGGSVGGAVINCHFNAHFWMRSPFDDNRVVDTEEWRQGIQQPWVYQYSHLDAFVLGDCREAIQFNNTVFGALNGLRCVEQNGSGASGVILGHGSDGVRVSVRFDALSTDGLTLINSQLVSMNCPGHPVVADKSYVVCGERLRSAAQMINTTLWGIPVHPVVVQGGELSMTLASVLGGGPLAVHGGRLDLTGVFLEGAPGDPDVLVSDGGEARLTACLTRGPTRVVPESTLSTAHVAHDNYREPVRSR